MTDHGSPAADTGDMSGSLINVAGSTDNVGDEQPKQTLNPFKWFMESPFKRYPFAVFILFGVLTFLWLILYFTSGETGFVMAGIAAIIMSIYGANHFRILLGLKAEVDKMSRLNNDFRTENASLKTEVDKLSKARAQLTEVENGLQQSNLRLKENLQKFRQLDENLRQLSGSNIEGLEKLQQSSQRVMSTMKESLIRHEKQILFEVYKHLQMNDGKRGLDEDEYGQFLAALPQSYRDRFERQGHSFQKLAGKNGIIDMKEFMHLCDTFAEEEALAGGS